MNRILYAILCISVFGCIPVLLKAQPVANFSTNSLGGCAPVVVQFADLSTGSPTSWSWTLGNGATSNLQNPSTTYTTPGIYTVSLTATNASGTNTKTITNVITVSAQPFANFTVDDSVATCPPRVINFQNLSIPNGIGATTYLWDFGDGTTSSAAAPQHNYTAPGNYTVTLVVTNASGCTKTITKSAYIHMRQIPNADFSSTSNIACTAPASVSFTNISTGATSYNWSFGDGNTAPATSPTHTYNSTGAYTVSLIASDANGCVDTVVKTAFVVIAHPIAGFSVGNNLACTGVPVTFNNQSLPASVNSLWSFGDGATSTLASPTHSYTTAGAYTVKLVSSAAACVDSVTHTVTISNSPILNFTANNAWGCTAPFTVQFQNATTNGSTWAWDFGDGSTLTSQNPSHTYSSAGIYTVSLVATSAGGCSDSLIRTNYIAVGQQPTASLNASAPAGTCIPTLYNFTPSITPSVTPISISYNYGDGATGTTPSHTYTTAGTYTVTYTYTLAAGCAYSTTVTVVAGTHPTASFTAAPLTTCPATNVTFTNTSTGATSYLWLYGDGLTGTATNPLHSYEVQGPVTVALIAIGTGGCADTMTRLNYITVQLPHAQFSSYFTCANKLQANFTDNSAGADSWFWQFGDGSTSTSQSPSHTYASTGTDTVKLTVHNNATGCNDTYISTIILGGSPVLNLVATDSSTCKNTAVNFVVDNLPNANNYLWVFGDAATYNGGNVAQHVYTTSGIYTIKVIVTDAHGCLDTVTKPNYVTIGGPTANFAASAVTGCLPLNVVFTDQTNTNFPIVSRVWRYGDGTINTSNSGNPAHMYTTNGSFSVSLILIDSHGCKDSVTKVNYIQATKPHAQFSSGDTIVCVNSNVNFSNASTGNNLSYLWNFGDGVTTFATIPFHAYNTPGTYTVSLVVTDGVTGCKDTMIRTAYVRVGSLAASFTINDSFATCPPLAVVATNTTPGNNTYTWSFGNGVQSVFTNATTVYTYPGVYHVKLVVHNSSGCVDSSVHNVAVLGPTGSFAVNTLAGCSPLNVLLSVGNSSGATSYTWDLNNGYTQTTSATSLSYTYTTPGKYVPLVVISNGTCQVPVMGDTVYSDHLSADFTFPAVTDCSPAAVSFTDTSWATFSPIASRSWSFGDGGTSFAHNPVHTYASGGTYQVRLIISNVSGCTDTVIKSVTVTQKPIITVAGNQAICPGQTTQVTLSATGAATYVWTPGTGLACATCANTTVLPATTTTYTLVGAGPTGCKDTVTTTVVVNTVPTVSGGPDETICAGHPATLNATGAATYVWSPAAGLSCTTCAAPVAGPATTTIYTLTGTAANGCSAMASVTVSVNAVPAPALDSSKHICTGMSVTLPGTAPGATSYTWYPAAGLSCTTCATPVANPLATTSYALVTLAGNGCNDTAHIVLVVNKLPVVSAPSQSLCAGLPTQITATGASTYIWSPGTGLSCSGCAAPFVSISTSNAYTIVGTDTNGCQDSTSILLTVVDRVPTSVGKGDSVCYGTPVPLSATGGESYTWVPAGSLNNASIAAPVATPGSTTNYTVYIKENSCFTDTDNVTIVVYPLPKVSIGADQTILDGETAQINVTSSLDITNFSWSPPDGLSCNDCHSPAATPKRTTTYTVTATGQGGCKDSAKTTIYLKCQNGQVFIPNIFTPNGDGANDRFYVSGKGIMNVKKVAVYNRWGEVVYEGVDVPVNDPQSGWDGKYKGQLLKPDVFVYVMTVVCETGELLEYKGDVSLIQ